MTLHPRILIVSVLCFLGLSASAWGIFNMDWVMTEPHTFWFLLALLLNMVLMLAIAKWHDLKWRENKLINKRSK